MTIRSDLIEDIEVAMVEFREIALRREIAEMQEIQLDAKEAADDDTLRRLAAQFEELCDFIRRRAKSGQTFDAVVPRGRAVPKA